MKNLICLCVLVVAGCSKSASSVYDYQLPLQNYHIGEYLQVENSNTLISVNRSAEQSGLVRINLSTNEMMILDPTAKAARDIFLANEMIAYRVDQEVRLWNHRVTTLLTNVARLRTFVKMNNYSRITYETLDKESRWMTFRDDGKLISDGPLLGSGRASYIKNGIEYVVLQNSEGLYFGQFGGESDGLSSQWLVESGTAGAYVAARAIGENLYIAYFDSETGVLKIATKDSLGNNFQIEDVDGVPNKSYRGMDIAMFNDHGKPGLVYLDGWALKLRLARRSLKGWSSQELPIAGAVGFYNQIISEHSDWISIASHNFRSEVRDYKQSFEDLAVFKLRIDSVP